MKNYSIKQLHLGFALLSILSTNTTFTHIAQDLELNKVFESINRTHTAQGKKALQELLATPTSDEKVLRDRQSVISYLVDHSAKHKEIIDALKQVSMHEESIEQAFAQSSSVENASLQQFYFSSDMFKNWNESPIGLELGQIAHFANLMSSSVQHCLTWLILSWGLGEKHACPSCPTEHDHDHHTHDKKKKHEHGHDAKDHKHEKKHDHKHDHVKDHGHAHNHDKKKKHDHGDHHDHNHAEDSTIKTLKSALFAWHTVAFFQELYSVCATTCNELHVIKELQQQLMTVAHGIRSIKTVHTLIHDHSEITAHLRLHQNLDAVCNQVDVSNKLNTLLELLETRTFKGEPSVFSRMGNILAAYKLLQEVAEELQPALQAIGEIDACSSCAQLMAEHESSPLRYSFAQYETEQTTPHIQTCNFWHPLIDTTEVTMNSLSLGIDNLARNALLTGPNACGKSTSLKSLTLCTYLAQTLSIVPAERHCQTIFKEIYSSMVIADQIQQGKSLFVTELENAHALLQRVAMLAPGECIFIALDELFKSTQHEKGQQVAYQLLKKLHSCPQVITVATTHFEEPAKLAKRNISACTNYTVENFKLIPGVGAFDDMGNDNYFN